MLMLELALLVVLTRSLDLVTSATADLVLIVALVVLLARQAAEALVQLLVLVGVAQTLVPQEKVVLAGLLVLAQTVELVRPLALRMVVLLVMPGVLQVRQTVQAARTSAKKRRSSVMTPVSAPAVQFTITSTTTHVVSISNA